MRATDTTTSAGHTFRTHNLEYYLRHIDLVPIDSQSITQDRLNIIERNRTSLFPWRGQFSPEFIETLLDHYALPADTVLDPFVGSGTVLFECTRKGLRCHGTEVNPVAVTMARTVRFAPLDLVTREKFIKDALDIIGRTAPCLDPLSWQGWLRDLLTAASESDFLYNIIANTVIRSFDMMGKARDTSQFFAALSDHIALIRKLPYTDKACDIWHADAKSLPIPANSIELIITSPPYINVFNYHQYLRPAAEFLGWNVLEVARSEIGSNRKNRGNRFLTVIQYAIDMAQSLREMRRVIRPGGRAIVIVGRESTVRGVSFQNGRLIAALAPAAGFCVRSRQERWFTTRYGEKIYEDILHLTPASESKPTLEPDLRSFARSLAAELLRQSVSTVDKEDVRSDVFAAISQASEVGPSTLFHFGTAVEVSP